MAVEAYHTVMRTYIRLVTPLARLYFPLSCGGIDLHTTMGLTSAASPAPRGLLAPLAGPSLSVASSNVHTRPAKIHWLWTGRQVNMSYVHLPNRMHRLALTPTQHDGRRQLSAPCGQDGPNALLSLPATAATEGAAQ